MSPYAPLYRANQPFAWLLSLLWICLVALIIRRRFSEEARSERWLSSALFAFRSLALLVCIIFIVGLVFLIWLKVVSPFWNFWEVMFILSVTSVFWIFPVVVVGFSCWVCLGRFRQHDSKRSLALYWQCLVVVAVDVLLYYAMQSFFA